MVDLKIIEKCKRKDELAYKQCYNACAPYVYSIVKNYIYDFELRKDAMQEVFSQVFVSINKFDPSKGKFKSWISQIAIHRCISVLRKSKKLNLVVHLDTELEIADYTDTISSINKEDLEKLLVNMPEGYRTIFLLNIVDDYAHKEIAELLKISVNTSRSQLSRAIVWIQKNLSLEIKNYIYG